MTFNITLRICLLIVFAVAIYFYARLFIRVMGRMHQAHAERQAYYTQQLKEIDERAVGMNFITEIMNLPDSPGKDELVDQLLFAYIAWIMDGRCSTPFMDWMIEQASENHAP